MEAWIKMRNVQKTIDDFTLGPINFTLEPGTITALVGNNGSGKSTLLKLITHLAKQDLGDIDLFGQALASTEKDWKPHIAYLPQTAVGVDLFTGLELRTLTAQWCPQWDEELFKSIVDQFNIPLTKKYSNLSQGVQQKLQLALTIPRNASILILDEPTSFLDIPSTKMLGDILMDWMDNGERSIFLTSHQVEDVRKLADYIAILNNGQMLGTFEKGHLQEQFRRYWLKTDLPNEQVPGEISRTDKQFVTKDAQAVEIYLNENNIEGYEQKALDLEDIITILMIGKEN